MALLLLVLVQLVLCSLALDPIVTIEGHSGQSDQRVTFSNVIVTKVGEAKNNVPSGVTVTQTHIWFNLKDEANEENDVGEDKVIKVFVAKDKDGNKGSYGLWISNSDSQMKLETLKMRTVAEYFFSADDWVKMLNVKGQKITWRVEEEGQETIVYTIKKDEKDEARYVGGGDYYAYDGGYQDIDSSRLIEYAYKMGMRAGSRKASQRNRRYDDYYR